MNGCAEDVAVVVRSAGERTEQVCLNLLNQQVSAADVVLVREKPFSKALVRSFEVGVERGLPWMLCVDADVLVTRDAVAQHLKWTRELPPQAFGMSGFLLDKFY